MTVKTAKLPEPPQQLVQIAEARRASELHRINLRRESAESGFALTRTRLLGNTDPATAERTLAPQRQGIAEIARTISEIEALTRRELVLRYVPEVDESEWPGRRPAF